MSQHSSSSMTEHIPYSALEYAASLKGLLKPFKGKGDYEQLMTMVTATRDELIKELSKIEEAFQRSTLSLLDLRLRTQGAASGTRLLRWRTKNLTKMGVKYWERVVKHPNTPEHLRAELLRYEEARIVLNMQISMLHSIYNQAEQCLQKLNHAHSVATGNTSSH